MTLKQFTAMSITLLAVGACEVTRVHFAYDGADAEQFRTDRKDYSQDEPGTLILHNTADVTLGYNLCWSILERQANGRWEPVQRDQVCTAELYSLKPSESVSYEDDLSDIRETGRYRFRTTVEGFASNDRRDLVTPPFRIE